MDIVFNEYVEYVTADGVFPVALEQHDLASPFTLIALKQGYAHVAVLGRTAPLEAAALTALKDAAPYHADVVANEITGTDPATIVDNLIAVRSRPEWHVGLQCVAADLARTKGVYFNPADKNLYACIQAHIAQSDWRPDLSGLGALWIGFYEPEAGPQPWVQPYGGSGTYVSGSIVTHKGSTWINTIPAPTLNVWEPGVYGWQVV
jgi:hypothetical protein